MSSPLLPRATTAACLTRACCCITADDRSSTPALGRDGPTGPAPPLRRAGWPATAAISLTDDRPSSLPPSPRPKLRPATTGMCGWWGSAPGWGCTPRLDRRPPL
eukprot:365428-Chlamydomonas_euryale.AAC.14